MLSTLAHMARARSSFTSPGACQASKLIASALEMVRRCPSAHSFLACLNTLCAHQLTCTSRVTTGQAATAEAKRAPLRPTHSALKFFDLVLSNHSLVLPLRMRSRFVTDFLIYGKKITALFVTQTRSPPSLGTKSSAAVL